MCTVDNGGSNFTGRCTVDDGGSSVLRPSLVTAALRLPPAHIRIGISKANGIAYERRPLLKAIDVAADAFRNRSGRFRVEGPHAFLLLRAT